jgi:hypothetical protein
MLMSSLRGDQTMTDPVWGYGYPIGTDGCCLWIYADCMGRPPLDDVFELVARKLWKGDREYTQRFARVYQSVVLFGYERSESPEEELHNAYNRMWAKHPELWERIQLRGFPMTFWALDSADRAFFGIIQPARDRAFLQCFSVDFRETPMYAQYAAEDPVWGMVTAPIHPMILLQARQVRG